MDNVFGNRLKKARKAAGLSLRDLADQVGVSHAAIQKYEKGEIYPSSDFLIKISKAIQIPVEHLFRPETIKLGTFSFRKKSTLGLKAWQEIEYQVKDKLERRLELENCYPFPIIKAFDLFHVHNFKINDYVDIEDVVVKTRNSWQLGLAPIRDLIDVFENNGIRVIEVDAKHDSFDGLFFLANNQPIVVISNNWPGDRQRFTLGHELGHLLLEKCLPKHLDVERSCNWFAGSFIFPKQAIQQEFGKSRSSIELRELLLAKQEYGLSMAGVLYRLFQSQIISESIFKKWQILFTKKGWRKREPGEQLPSEISHVFEQMIFHALGKDYISESKAAELLNISIETFRRLRLINERICSGC